MSERDWEVLAVLRSTALGFCLGNIMSFFLGINVNLPWQLAAYCIVNTLWVWRINREHL
jgi:hypothetical protein